MGLMFGMIFAFIGLAIVWIADRLPKIPLRFTRGLI